ncbi:hypothetical protein BC826DRAFT_193195 [Russula brevipes]|nr:hypothetical protein BC826DRAFT_193195 [Russula brevipes]
MCQTWITLHCVFAYIVLASASLLIVIRVIAIWNKDKIIMTIAIGVWVINVASLIISATRLRYHWFAPLSVCVPANVHVLKPNLISTLITDIVLLLVMLVGLHRARLDGGGLLSLGEILWKQGIIWLFLATMAEVPPVVLMCLDLNAVFDAMFTLPLVVTLSIAATRIHRSLVDHVHGSTVIRDSRGCSYPCSNIMQNPVAHNTDQFNRTEGTVHTTRVQYPTTHMSRDITMDMDKEGHHKPSVLIADEDLERGVTK